MVQYTVVGRVADGDVTHLTWLKDKMDTDLVDSIVVTTGLTPNAERAGPRLPRLPCSVRSCCKQTR